MSPEEVKKELDKLSSDKATAPAPAPMPDISEKDLLKIIAAGIQQLAQQQVTLNTKLHTMNDNLTAGYKATQETLSQTLKPLSDMFQQAQQQQQQMQQMQQQQNTMGGGQPMGNFSGAGFDPFNAKKNNGGMMGNGQQMQQMMPNGQGNPMMFYLLDKMFQPDPSQSMYAMLGQRVFAESIMANMYMNKAAMRKLREKNLLDEDDWNAFNSAQNTMYGPLLGQGKAQQQAQQQQQPIGGQPNGNSQAEQ